MLTKVTIMCENIIKHAIIDPGPSPSIIATNRENQQNKLNRVVPKKKNVIYIQCFRN